MRGGPGLKRGTPAAPREEVQGRALKPNDRWTIVLGPQLIRRGDCYSGTRSAPALILVICRLLCLSDPRAAGYKFLDSQPCSPRHQSKQELHDPLLATVYLGSFCLTSIAVMGGFAAAFGEATVRLADRQGAGGSRSLLRCMSLVSAGLSLVVGVLWLVLLYFGVLDQVFG